MTRLLILILSTALALAGEALAETPNPGAPDGEESVDVSADHMVRDGETQIVKAWGNVVVHFEDRTLKADKVRIDQATGYREAKGNIEFTAAGGTRLTAERARFNLKSKQGKIFRVLGKIEEQYYVRGREVTRQAADHYLLNDAALTTCQGRVPDWMFQASHIDMVVNDRALFTHAIFKVKDIPILYLPAGYIPIHRDRKSGLLLPKVGVSSTDGFIFGEAYYWAINGWSDATISAEYLSKRGVRPGLEYRYTPSQTTRGQFNGKFLDDSQTGNQFWKINATHWQALPLGFKFNGKLDLGSNANFNKTFEDDIDRRSQRSFDSYGAITRGWDRSTLDLVARYRESTQDNRDDTFAQLPDFTFSNLNVTLGGGPVLFNQDTNYTFFHLDQNPTTAIDDNFDMHRLDFHPQLSAPLRAFSWGTFTPTVGIRETFYSKGLGPGGKETGGFSRELFEVGAAFEGPKVNRVFHIGGMSKFKHILEPRVTYQFIPDIDEADRGKIRIIDEIDRLGPGSRLTYSLTQRLLAKTPAKYDSFATREVLRFEVSQSYDFREATFNTPPLQFVPPGQDRKPFSDIRFDLDSRLIESLLLNVDTTYDVYNDSFDTLNVEVGVKPTTGLMLYAQRRQIRGESTFITGTLDWIFAKGWRFLASTRYDERAKAFRQNNVSLLYDNNCRCWGAGVDIIDRKIITGGVEQDELRVLFNITLRGLGSIRSSSDQQLLHRTF